jgi:hypothetical protein
MDESAKAERERIRFKRKVIAAYMAKPKTHAPKTVQNACPEFETCHFVNLKANTCDRWSQYRVKQGTFQGGITRQLQKVIQPNKQKQGSIKRYCHPLHELAQHHAHQHTIFVAGTLQ